MNKYYVGLDIGGSHIAAGIIEWSNEQTITPLEVNTQLINSGDKAEAILEKWVRSIVSTCQERMSDPPDGLGFAMPGPFHYEKGIAAIERWDPLESTCRHASLSIL